jgi:hypothetical protein
MVPTAGCPYVQHCARRKGVCLHWAGGGDILEEWTTVVIFVMANIISYSANKAHSSSYEPNSSFST